MCMHIHMCMCMCMCMCMSSKCRACRQHVADSSRSVAPTSRVGRRVQSLFELTNSKPTKLALKAVPSEQRRGWVAARRGRVAVRRGCRAVCRRCRRRRGSSREFAAVAPLSRRCRAAVAGCRAVVSRRVAACLGYVAQKSLAVALLLRGVAGCRGVSRGVKTATCTCACACACACA
jgi:hypothetical protein